MPVLSDNDRIALRSKLGSDLSRIRAAWPLNKADTQAAIDAADDWADQNATAFNSALPLAARTNLTAQQKAYVLMLVIARRWEVG